MESKVYSGPKHGIVDYRRALNLIPERLDRTGKSLNADTLPDFSGDKIIDSRKIGIPTKLSGRTLLRRRTEGGIALRPDLVYVEPK